MRARNKQKVRAWKISIHTPRYIGSGYVVYARTYGSACRKFFKAIGFTPKSTPEGGFEGVSAEVL